MLFAANIDVKGFLLCGCNWLGPRLFTKFHSGRVWIYYSLIKEGCEEKLTHRPNLFRFLGFQSFDDSRAPHGSIAGSSAVTAGSEGKFNETRSKTHSIAIPLLVASTNFGPQGSWWMALRDEKRKSQCYTNNFFNWSCSLRWNMYFICEFTSNIFHVSLCAFTQACKLSAERDCTVHLGPWSCLPEIQYVEW